MAKQRGRPKSPETLEKERIEAMFANLPAHTPRMSDEEQKEKNAHFDANKKIEEELIADFSPTIPDEIIYQLASLDDESMHGHKEAVLKKYEKFQVAEHNGRLSGAKKTADKAKARANAVWGKSQDLVKRIGTSHSVHSASQKILDDWVNRGDKGKKPSIRSIQNWYQTFISK